MQDKIKKLELNLNDKKFYIFYSFIISAVILFIYFLFSGMIAGEYIIMRSDLISGVIGEIKGTCREIINGDNIWFSFSTGLGMGKAISLATCCLSPFNILYILFFNADENLVTAIVLILKVGSISASFNYFCKKCLGNEKFSSVLISVFYSLCAYTIAYGAIQIEWLDALIILPLLCSEIINCIKNNKRVLLTILYSYLFISQFYMGYMVGIFSLIFTLLYLFIIYKEKEISLKIIFSKFFNWFLSVVVAILISSIVWIPALFFISANRVSDSSNIFNIESSLLQILNSLYWGNGYGIEGTYSYIYCGTIVLLLVPLYFINNKISKNEKLFSAIILSFLFCSTIFTPLNSFLHVFDQPDCFWYRYSFLISFCLCSISARQLAVIDDIDFKKVFIVYGVLIVFYLIVQQSVSLWLVDGSLNPSQNNNIGFLCNVIFLISWIFIFYIYVRKKFTILTTVLSLMLLFAEIVSCSIKETSIKEYSKDYYEWYNIMSESAEIINSDEDLFRTIANNNTYINYDSWFGLNGFSELGSNEKLSVRNALANMGFSTSTRFIDDGGHTPVSEMLLGVKYNIKFPYSLIDYEDNDIEDLDRCVENENYVGIGYLVFGGTSFYEWNGRNVFENMNSLVSEMTGDESKCFDEIPEEDIEFDSVDMDGKIYEDGSVRLKRTDDIGNYYVTVKNNNYSNVYLQVQTDDIGNYGYDFYIMGTKNAGSIPLNNAKLSAASEMYYNEESNKYNVYLVSQIDSSPDKLEFDALNVYGLNEKVLKEQKDILYQGRYIIDKWSNGHIEGRVYNSGERNLLFLSIPYDPGWKVKVNGKDGEIVKMLDGAFMGVFLPGEGEYNIIFDYECPGLKIGLYCSLCGILGFLSIVFEKKLKKKTGNK